ncbi:MAG: TPM domain-containing protein [Burkholderiales bacterium]|nr:TPM domain-containing protein [Burkholderiales bacterium]
MSRRTGLARWLHHLWVGPLHVRAAFPPDAMRRIEAAIGEGERRHTAELRFCVESSLDTAQLLRGLSARARALEVFGQFGVWDTEHDNGVLVYLLWADRAVEIVADRGATRSVDPAVWARACEQLARGCRDGTQLDGALACIATLTEALAAPYPADGRDNPDELPNAPLVL